MSTPKKDPKEQAEDNLKKAFEEMANIANPARGFKKFVESLSKEKVTKEKNKKDYQDRMDALEKSKTFFRPKK